MNTIGVIRTILSVGAGLLVTTAIGSFICISMIPINLAQCVIADQQLLDFLLKNNHFMLSQIIGGSSAGAFVYYLTGKWNRN